MPKHEDKPSKKLSLTNKAHLPEMDITQQLADGSKFSETTEAETERQNYKNQNPISKNCEKVSEVLIKEHRLL